MKYATLNVSGRTLELSYEEFADLGQCYHYLEHNQLQDIKINSTSMVFVREPKVNVRSERVPEGKINKLNTGICPHGYSVTNPSFPGIAGNCPSCRGNLP